MTADPDKEPVFSLQLGSRWTLSNHRGGSLRVEVGAMMNTVYIHDCSNVDIDVDKKCKNIMIDGCDQITVTFPGVLASVEITNSTRAKVSCTSSVPTISVDKCQGVTICLPSASLGVSLYTSLSSEVSVKWPDPEAVDKFIEKSIPHQYLHTISGDTLTTHPARLY
jgi:Adenylate cyclase associated (CAP) C terminal